MTGFLTVPDLAPIVDAIRDARAVIVSSEPAWADSILDGGPAAFEAGERLMREIEAVASAMNSLIELTQTPAGVRRIEFDSRELEAALGATAVVDAMLVAMGELPHDDPVIHDRFKPVRLEHERVRLERWIAEAEREGRDTSVYRAELDMVAVGIEPE